MTNAAGSKLASFSYNFTGSGIVRGKKPFNAMDKLDQ